MKTDNNNESFSKADFLNLESFYDDTKYEWYVAKHRRPSPAELSLMNALWGTSDRGYKQNMSFEDLKKFIEPLIKDEEEKDGMFNPYLAS